MKKETLTPQSHRTFQSRSLRKVTFKLNPYELIL